MKLFLSFFILFTSFTIYSQTVITGKILEKGTNSPLEFAEIILTPKPLGEVFGTVTNVEGAFILSAAVGKYKLQVSYVGQFLYTSEIEIKGETIELGEIMVNNSNQLGEIVINARKKLIVRKIDRLVFNVANSSKASQGDAIEVLKITPGIRVENDKITMIGKGNLQVMIEDKIVQLSGPDLINYLRSLASETIESIEVIHNPPAKYEASGNSGLINIVLKKARNDSWNAQLKGTYLQRSKPNYRTSGTFIFNKNKLSIASRFSYISHMLTFDEELAANFPEEQWNTSGDIHLDLEGYVATADLSYQITENWEMGGQYYYNGTRVRIGGQTSTIVSDYDTNRETRSFLSDGFEPQHPKLHSVNFNNTIKLDSLGRKIILNVDHFIRTNPDRKIYEGISILQEPYTQQYFRSFNVNKKEIKNYSAKLDAEYPVQWMDLDFGGKLSRLDSYNDISFFNSGLSDQPIEEMALQTNDFTYKENIGALYLSANRKFGEKWSAQLGVRMEDTQIDAFSDVSDLARNDHYTNLFPTFYLSYNTSDFSTFSLNYSRRIERPTFYDLNPNLYYRNPFQAFEGNPFLEPAFIHNVELSNIYKNMVTKIYVSHEDNLFAEILLPNTNTNSTLFTIDNYIKRKRIGLSESYTYDAITWWTSTNNLDMNYSESEFDLEQEIGEQSGYNATISTYNDFNLNASKTIIAGLNYWYQFPGVEGIFKTKATSSLGLSLQYFLLEKDLNITIRGDDLFRTAIERKSTNINGVYQELRNFYDTRQFWLSVSYKFGNKNLNGGIGETGNEEEKARF